MRNSEFRAQGLPIGSGIVESAHEQVLQVRMKQAGQRWSIERGRRVVLLRAPLGHAAFTGPAERLEWTRPPPHSTPARAPPREAALRPVARQPLNRAASS